MSWLATATMVCHGFDLGDGDHGGGGGDHGGGGDEDGLQTWIFSGGSFAL